VLFLLPDQSPCDNVEKKKRMSTLLQEVVGFQNSVLGALSPRIAETRYLLGLHNQENLEQYDGAIRYFKEASCIWKSSLGKQCQYALDADQHILECQRLKGDGHCIIMYFLLSFINQNSVYQSEITTRQLA
jgi:hypothetical protein